MKLLKIIYNDKLIISPEILFRLQTKILKDEIIEYKLRGRNSLNTANMYK